MGEAKRRKRLDKNWGKFKDKYKYEGLLPDFGTYLIEQNRLEEFHLVIEGGTYLNFMKDRELGYCGVFPFDFSNKRYMCSIYFTGLQKDKLRKVAEVLRDSGLLVKVREDKAYVTDSGIERVVPLQCLTEF